MPDWAIKTHGALEEKTEEWQKALESFIAKTSIRVSRLLPDSWGISTVYADTKEQEDEILKK